MTGCSVSAPVIRNFTSRTSNAPGTSSRRASCSKTVRSGIATAPDSMGISIVGGSGIGCWMADRAAEGAKKLLGGREEKKDVPVTGSCCVVTFASSFYTYWYPHKKREIAQRRPPLFYLCASMAWDTLNYSACFICRLTLSGQIEPHLKQKIMAHVGFQGLILASEYKARASRLKLKEIPLWLRAVCVLWFNS